MKYIQFGSDKEKVSKVILGMMRTSDLSINELTDLCKTALDEGINYFDTADCYGNGRQKKF